MDDMEAVNVEEEERVELVISGGCLLEDHINVSTTGWISEVAMMDGFVRFFAFSNSQTQLVSETRPHVMA